MILGELYRVFIDRKSVSFCYSHGSRLTLKFQRRSCCKQNTDSFAEHCDLSLNYFCLYCKRWKWVIELRRLLKDRVKEEWRGRWNRGDICAYRPQLKGWYPDGEIREREDKGGKEDIGKRRGWWERGSEREAENGYHVGRLEKERIAAPADSVMKR